ncbi:NAD(P)-dependent oxidoreductase [Tichowtungia aerotolerans]|uniref:Phosphoglycerate dehydrogenase n=1 Tax=Tichowtungia aerotolerans TaxID=2697043 RepID=A0A6P1M8C1_9BACT|nr:NAD(P)-dependent oxidoreductase [Tichowtungia aerotolerans]QHI70121.1 phosphoglycerate dehydrogenase [Tichowtungia aerotolerans]
MRRKIKSAILNDGVSWTKTEGDHIVSQVYAGGRMEVLTEITDLYPEIITTENFDAHAANLQDLEVVFSTWGMVSLSKEQLLQLPSLKAVFYAAGATSSFRAPLVDRGIKVCSAAAANAIPVAEFALGQILLAGAGFFRNTRECTDEKNMRRCTFRGTGNYDSRVAILGNGTISTRLQEFLSMHNLEVVVVPSRTASRTVSLEEAFATSFAVVNLFPDRDDNVGVFNAALFEKMMDGAVFINVGRGRQVNEADLIRVLKNRPDLTASLDVQWPEPPVDGSELYRLPNVLLTPHTAGSKAAELVRMADYMIEDFHRFNRNEPLKYEVTPDQL